MNPWVKVGIWSGASIGAMVLSFFIGRKLGEAISEIVM